MKKIEIENLIYFISWTTQIPFKTKIPRIGCVSWQNAKYKKGKSSKLYPLTKGYFSLFVNMNKVFGFSISIIVYLGMGRSSISRESFKKLRLLDCRASSSKLFQRYIHLVCFTCIVLFLNHHFIKTG